MHESKRPPIGIMPRWRWLEIQNGYRLVEVISAIKRFYQAQLEVPEQWVDEYHLLINETTRNIWN